MIINERLLQTFSYFVYVSNIFVYNFSQICFLSVIVSYNEENLIWLRNSMSQDKFTNHFLLHFEKNGPICGIYSIRIYEIWRQIKIINKSIFFKYLTCIFVISLCTKSNWFLAGVNSFGKKNVNHFLGKILIAPMCMFYVCT